MRRLTRLLVVPLVVLAATVTGATAAEAKQIRYVGLHPLADGPDDGVCYIEAPHVHVVAPRRAKVLYRVHDGAYAFVGDPVAYGYEGPRHTYYGHHPVHLDVIVDGAPPEADPEFCYLDGPHFHAWEPPAGVTFTVKGDASWYVGPFPPRYKQDKRRYGEINAVYRPMVYARPAVTVEPPVGYLGPVVEVHAPSVAVVAPAVEVHGPAVHAGVEVHVPVPTIEIGIGLPGLVVEERHVHRHGKHKHGKYKHGKYKRGKHKRSKHKQARYKRVHTRDHR